MNHENLILSPTSVVHIAHAQLVHPADVVNNHRMTIDEKRRMLAAWPSESKAVPDQPTLRQLDNGTVVSLATLIEALKELDALDGGRRHAAADRSHDKVLNRWRKRSPWRRRPYDDDDGPPPPPAAASCIGRNWPVAVGAADHV